MRRSPRLIIAIVIALFSAVTYFTQRSTNEVTGEVQRISITPEQEIALGLQSEPEMAQQFGGAIDHAVVDDYVAAVGERVVSRSAAAKSPYRYNFHLLADPETINAFALPGGQIFITVGLLRRLSSEAQLAGVLGHEVGHVVGRHSAEHMAKAQFTQGLIGAVGVGTGDLSAQQVAAVVGQAVNMKYGRQDELESDSLGVVFMQDADYDPRGMMRLMQVLAEAGGARSQSEFFSTHPNPENRMQRLEALIAQTGGGGETAEDRFQQNVLKYLR